MTETEIIDFRAISGQIPNRPRAPAFSKNFSPIFPSYNNIGDIVLILLEDNVIYFEFKRDFR